MNSLLNSDFNIFTISLFFQDSKAEAGRKIQPLLQSLERLQCARHTFGDDRNDAWDARLVLIVRNKRRRRNKGQEYHQPDILVHIPYNTPCPDCKLHCFLAQIRLEAISQPYVILQRDDFATRA